MINSTEILRKERVKKLRDVCTFIGGGTPSKNNKSYWNGPIPWASIKDIKGKYLLQTSDFISEDGLKNSATNLVQPNEIILATRINPGRPIISKIKSAINQDLKIVRPKADIDTSYLYYAFLNYEREILKLSSGTTVKGITLNLLNDIEFVIPDLIEQTAIVSKIEELFSDIDKGVEDLKIAQQQLKTYRQSVLKWAFDGRLTNENVKESVLPKGWRYVNIEDIAKVGTGATPLKGNKNYYEHGKIAWVTSGALNDEFVRNATDYVTELALQETNLSLYPKHTLLLAMYGEGKTRGKCSELLIEATTNQAIAAISFENHDTRVKPFLKYFLLKNYNDIRMLSSGGVQPNLNLGIVKKTQLPFAPIEEQHLIVQEIESRLSVADKMEESINESLKQADALRQSILKKAFSGELI